MIEIHKAKQIVQLLNEQAQRVIGMNLTDEFEKQLLNPIDEIKNILQESKLKED